MSSLYPKRDWRGVTRRALGPTELVTRLAGLRGWTLSGDGDELAIERSFEFGSYFETMSFVNAVAYIAQTEDHHPELVVQWGRCAVRFRTHDAKGITATDFECAARVDELIERAAR